MTKTFGAVDLSPVIERFCDTQIQAPLSKEPRRWDEAEDNFGSYMREVEKHCGREIANEIDDVKEVIVLRKIQHYFSAGFLDGMRYAAYTMNLADSLKSVPVIGAGLQLAETAAAEVDEQ